ncbi:hypothetical protein Lesp02_84290 [Lentzea sp. NBRC 105346]|uniref:hypothetical protein n=1 Tax=Lentzea sp. NBRC 105346 TaxID=3032205 RepID=UPI00249FEECA|nr:hypothetical protein [Lentzea sp. NBRC 105346]GLZ36242.1 hypothetical protein Lesp02_84290 [Lentzea sp. NBRC 105346]
MGKRPRFPKTRHVIRHWLGMHSWRISIAGTVAGGWAWHVSCRCRQVHRGLEVTENDAHAEALRLVAVRDEYRYGQVYGTHGSHLWPKTPVLHVPAEAFPLPDPLRGTGSVVACDASIRKSDEHAGWAAITDAGWMLSGTVDGATENVTGLELLAIAQALRLYPDRHPVDVWSDNVDALNMARRILAGRVRRFVQCPAWVPYEAYVLLRKASDRQVNARISYVRSKATPLHRVADRLARALPYEHLLAELAAGPTSSGEER